jgi:hypothetical protein
MVGRRRRLGVALLLATTAFAASTAYLNEITDAGYLTVEQSPCYPCHVTWSPVPLRDFVTLVPATGVSGSIGQQMEYTMRVNNIWLADLTRFEPSLDVSHAPSLGFVTDRDPDLGQLVPGVLQAAATPTSGASGFVTIDVEAGVTDLQIRVDPANSDPLLGPDLIVNIYPMAEEPVGNPAETIDDETGGGTGESFHVTGSQAISELGFGTWVIEADAKGPLNAGTLGGIVGGEFSVMVDRWYNASEETIKFLSREELVKPGASTSFTWSLLVVGTPEAGETVRLALNLTSYYEHDDSANEDIGYTHHAITVPVAAVAGGGASFEEGDSGVIVVTTPDVGVSLSRVSELVGYVSAFLVVLSVWTGGMFGKTSRRQLNGVFATARRRVAFHNFLSYGIILAAVAHTVIFLWPLPNIEGNYHWTQGIIWGTLAILSMFGLGVTGALQVPVIRRWNYAVWRWSHLILSFTTIAFTVVHILLDGGNTGAIQDAVNWTNPLDPRTN